MIKRTHLLTDDAPLAKVLSGAAKVAKSVSVTLGPKGRNVIIRKAGFKAFMTHDGVTVAQAITLNDPTEDAVADLMKEAASNMEALTGDGTTTVTALTNAMLVGAAAEIRNGKNAMQVKRELEDLGEQAVTLIKEHVKDEVTEDELIKVATISSANAAIGKEIGEAVFKAGKDTPIILGMSESTETTIEVIKGIRISSGSASPYLFNEGAVKHEIEKPFIVVVDAVLRDREDVLPILQAINEVDPQDKKFLIVATDISSNALSLLIINKQRNFADISAVRVPSSINAPSQYLNDIAVSTGAKVLSRNTGNPLDRTSVEHFGRAEGVRIDLTETLIVGGEPDKHEFGMHKAQLDQIVKNGKSEAERKFAKDRLTILSQQVLSIYVGGQSESEAEEKHYRYEDAVGAARSALRGGIVPGGGVMLALIGNDLKWDALRVPYETVLYNAGLNTNDYTITYGNGVDVMHPEDGVIDLYERGILDPAESEIEAVKTAVSIAGLLLTTGATVVEEIVHESSEPQFSFN
jgi:chaperonin GroEL